MGLCDCTIKTILFLFNFACALVGLAIIAVAVLAKVQSANVTQNLGTMGTASIYALMGIGIFVFLVSFFGCCGVTRDDSCMITTYAFILTVLLLAQIAFGALILYYRVNISKQFQQGMEEAFNEYGKRENQQFIDTLQRQFHCCGPDGPNSFPTSSLPLSCCQQDNYSSQSSCPVPSAYPDGCTQKALQFLRNNMNILGITVLAIAAIELICIVLACCVSNSIRREKLQGYY